jgi:exoribonuclease-2
MNRLQTIAHRIMVERGLLPEFSQQARSELDAIIEAPAAHGPAIRDLRDLLWVSIDNDNSRDLDQLSVAEAMSAGAVKILVAIADVDALVKRGSAIDAHARTNTTSVYTAAALFPMLPERLSTDLTSLGQDEERLAIVVEILVSADGKVEGSEIYRAAVRNHAKLAYDSVAAWLDGTAPAPAAVSARSGIDEQLRIQDRVAQTLRKLRFQQGALTLQTPEARAVYEGDRLSDLRPEEANRAKELIEDFMVAANGVTARYLAERRFPALRRVLRSPERWDKIVSLAANLGERLPPEPDGEALAHFLTRRRRSDPVHFLDLSLSVVKLLGRGEYVLALPGREGEGHFGLAVDDYTHSTAPNRRFPDLVTQRLLKAALAAEPPVYGNDELTALARHCTEQEVNAAKVERQVNKCAAALLLTTRIGERFEGLVTGASEKGTWVRILHPATEGKVVRGSDGLEVGAKVRLELVQVDVERGFIDFAKVGAT